MTFKSIIKRTRTDGVLCFLLIAPFLIISAGLVFMSVNVPFSDDYDAILKYLNHPWPERASHITEFHNEHRIIATRLVSECVFQTLGHIDFRIVMWIGNIGWWLFAGTFAYIFARHGNLTRWGAVFVTWMLVGFYDQENAFWAMTSIQNHWVIAFAFASCLAFSRRADISWFTLSLAAAVAATFTSGGGLLVFPALALMAICNFIFATSRPPFNKFAPRPVIFMLVAISASTLLLHNLPCNNDPSLAFPTDPILRIKEAVLFFFCFFGNILPHVIPAAAAGVIVVTWGMIICWFAPRYRGISLAIFTFSAFCVANILAATIFRGGNADLALAGRYRLISAAIIVSFLYLTLVELPLSQRVKNALLALSLIGCFLVSTAYIIRGIIYNSGHKTELEAELAQRATNEASQDILTNETYRAYNSPILRESIRKGIFIPPQSVK